MKLFTGILMLLLFAVQSVNGQGIPDPMSPRRLVNDFAQVFTTSQESDLEQILRTYNDTTSTQIYVVTVSDLQGYDVSDYAARLGEKWGIGQKGKDNGAVILIKPKTSDSRGQVFIATGYGLEPVLTDGRVGQIIDEYMTPYFRQNDYYGGTKAAILVMIQYLSGEFAADRSSTSEGDDIYMWVFTIGLFILIIYLVSRKKQDGDDDDGNSSGGGGFFPPFFPPRGGFGGFGGGRSGGGFGGGGGGRFGGGGAGRSW